MDLGCLSDPPAPNLLVIQEHTGCSSEGALDSYHLASYGDLPRDTLEGVTGTSGFLRESFEGVC